MTTKAMCLDCGINPEANIGGICQECLDGPDDYPFNQYEVQIFETEVPENITVELKDYWDFIEKLEEAVSRDWIKTYNSNPTMEACLNLRDLDYTLYVLGTPHLECAA